MNNKLVNLTLLLVLLCFYPTNSAVAEAKEGKSSVKSLSKVQGAPALTRFNINNVSTFIRNDGESDVNAGNSGFEYPKNSNLHTVYQSGFLWGGKVNGEIRVGGSTFNQGLLPGAVINGVAESPDLPQVRIYRVRRDYATGNLTPEATNEGVSEAEIFAQYETDWNEWPAAAPYNAPYEDVDGDGNYNPAVDIPGVPGADQTVWFVANDLDQEAAGSLYGSPSMGIEMKATIFGYNAVGPLGNMLFRQYELRNVTTTDMTDFYVCMWSDPDVGNATDDFVGSDTSLSLGFAYNAFPNDATYGDTPPATGFDFFQGPLVDYDASNELIQRFNLPDSGKSGGEWLQGKTNLPMTAAFFFIRADPFLTDPSLGEYVEGTLEMYNFLQGRIGKTGALFTDPSGNQTTFTLAGDPVAGTGWIDGQVHAAGDRRYGLSSGPFTLSAGETQEIVVAQIAAGGTTGTNNLDAITLLKAFDIVAQDAYNNNFELPGAPERPKLTVSNFDREVLLVWDDAETVALTEGHSEQGYEFQGYNVWQMSAPSVTFEDINDPSRLQKIATFDIIDGVTVIIEGALQNGVTIDKITQTGNDTGIRRSLRVDTDALNSNIPFNNGSDYYFAITAYAYNPDPLVVPQTLENTLLAVNAVPQTTTPGVRYNADAGDVYEGVHATGVSDGALNAVIVDQSALTGHDYLIRFEEGDDGHGHTIIVWDLVDQTTGEVKLDNVTNQLGDESSPIVDGIQWRVSGPFNKIKDADPTDPIGNADGMVEIAYGGVTLTEADYDGRGTPYNGNTVWHSLNSAGADGNNDRYYASTNASGDLSRMYRYVDFASPNDYELRWTADGGFGVYAFEDDMIGRTTFELWNIGVATPDDPSDDYRMIPLLLSSNGEGGSTDWRWAIPDVLEGTFQAYPMSDAIYWMDPKDLSSPTAGYDAFHNSCVQSGGAGAFYDYSFDTDPAAADYNADFHGGFVYPIGRYVIAEFDGDGLQPPAGTVIRFNYTKPNGLDDTFTLEAPTVTNDAELAKVDVDKIKAFPNPYYGVNALELNKNERFITFNHLPTQAKIRIFNLAGQLVRTLDKNDESQFLNWDLNNGRGLPAASGLYIAYIDMPDIGKTKTLKIAIIQEEQILDRF